MLDHQRLDVKAEHSSPQSPSHAPAAAVGHVLHDRYELLHCIAHQKFSTVWLAKDSLKGGYVAVKVQSPGKPALPCSCVDVANLKGAHAPPGVPTPLDSFDLQSAHGKPDLKCIVMPLLGQPINVLFRPNTTIMPWDVVKQVAVSTLIALHYLHTVEGIVHTDIHPGNILLHPPESIRASVVEAFLGDNDHKHDEVGPIPFPEFDDIDELLVTLVDLETAHLSHNGDKHDFLIQPHHLRAPEVILGAKWGTPVDIWNFGCLIVEWTTGRSLFQYDTKTGNPQQILGHMVRALGHFPPELIAKGRFASKWFNADGTLKTPVEPVNLPFHRLLLCYLQKTPGYESLRAQVGSHEIACYIDCVSVMLCLDPDERFSAAELLNHPWLRPTLQRMHDRMVKSLEKEEAAKAAVAELKNPRE